MIAPGQEFGGYHLISVLGQGGMGTVFRAKSVAGDEVALKVLTHAHDSREELARRFQREVRLLRELDHPALVRFLDAGDVDGIPFLAMEVVSGKTLHETAFKAALPWARAVALGSQLAQALAYLHTRDLSHRDLSPANVMILEGDRLKLLDFGLAGGTHLTAITRTGEAMGTPTTMAPEMIVGGSGSAATDLWSLGCALYLMLAGRLPFCEGTMPQILGKIVHEPPPPLASLAPATPPALVELVHSLLVKQPEARPGAEEVARALARMARPAPRGRARPGSPVIPTTAPTGPATPVPSGFSVLERRRTLGALALVLFLAPLVWWTTQPRPAVLPPLPTPSAPSTGGSPAHLPDPALHSQAHRALLPALRSGGPAATAAVATLRAALPFDFGRAREHWLNWMEIEMWLESPPSRSGPPRSAVALPGPIGPIESNLVRQGLGSFTGGETWRRFSTLLRVAMEAPDDGRMWLIIGTEYKRLGYPNAARRFWRLGLTRLGALTLSETGGEGGRATAMALLAGTPGVEEQLASLLTREMDRGGQQSAWNGFVYELEQSAPESVRARILGELGFVDSRGLFGEATALFNTGRGKSIRDRLAAALLQPQSNRAAIANIYARICIYEGDRAAAQPALSVWDRTDPLVIAALEQPLDDPPSREPEHVMVRGAYAFRHLIDGRPERARAQLDLILPPQNTFEVQLRDVLAVDIAGALQSPTGGVLDPALASIVTSALTTTNVKLLWPAWDEASGALHLPGGERLVLATLNAMPERPPLAPYAQIFQAIYSSRAGRHADALAALENALRQNRAAILPPDDNGRRFTTQRWIAEIITRPIWTGVLTPAEVMRRVDSLLADTGLDAGARRVYEAIRGADFALAAARVRELQPIPSGDAFPHLAELWELTRTKDTAGLAAYRKLLDSRLRSHLAHTWLLREWSK